MCHFFKLLPNPKPWSEKWMSPYKNHHKSPSAEYFADCLQNPILFSETRKQIPEKSLIVEISPKNVVSDLKLTLLEETGNSMLHFLDVLAQLYIAGIDMDLTKLYPAVPYPVSRGTPMISPLIKWQHSQEWYVLNKLTGVKGASGHAVFRINVNDEEFKFYTGHVVDRRNLFPATGYLYLVWNAFAAMNGSSVPVTEVSFKCKNVKFLRATHISKESCSHFIVMVQSGTGNFEVMESNTAIVTGNISVLKSSVKRPNTTGEISQDQHLMDLSSKDIYKELRLRGYQYSGLFRSLMKANQENTYGEVRWSDNWVAFLDNLLQMKILSIDSRGLYVPTSIDEISVDLATHEEIKRNLGPENVFPIHVNNKLNIIRSGGVEIKGIKASPITRKKPLGEPVLERYQFVPYHVTDGSLYNLQQTVTICVHTLLENNGISKLDVAELVPNQKEPGTQLLASIFSRIIENLPLMKVEITLYGDLENPCIKDLETPVKVEAGTLSPNEKYHVIIVHNFTQNIETSNATIAALHDGGCIISREQPGVRIPESCQELDVVVDQPVGNGRFIMFKKKNDDPELDNNTTIIHITEANFDWLPQLQAAVKQGEPHKRILLVAQGEPTNGIIGLFNCLRREPGGAIARCFLILDEDAPTFDPKLPSYHAQMAKDLAVNVLKDGQWGSYRHHLIEKLPLVDGPQAFANTAVHGDLSTFTWFQGPLDPLSLKSNQADEFVHVYYSALNFRDVMLASGRLAIDVVMPHRMNQDCAIGFEFSGRTATGRRVMGTMAKGAMASCIEVDPDLIWAVPEHWSLQDAATVPVIYATVCYALRVSTHIKKGESILIHAASGGVGQAAIYFALHFGLTIFTTVGTKEKKDFIRKHFPQIPEKNIGNSRDTSFEQMVMQETNGRGVDLVLNSLAEEKLQASLRCLAIGGRFLEIGKFDLAANNQISLELFLKNISYHGVMLDLAYTADTSTKKKLHDMLQEAIDSGAVQPLKSCTVFGVDEVEQAFRYMAAGKHIGKVLIKIRDEEAEKSAIPSVKMMKVRPRFYCDTTLSYIIVGGLGGFGLELADWLVLRGAKTLILTSRRGISNGYQSSRVRLWRSYGVKVHISTEDVSTEQGVRQLLTDVNSAAPVGGIFNLAVVLHDAILENQTTEYFAESAKAKAVATRHFDALSREMCPELQKFVVFSSVSCGRGNAGQTNYGMSNSVMERICERRVREGLPGLAIQWGAVGEVGLVADMQEDNRELVIGGTLQQSIGSCLEVLDGFLKQTCPVVASMVVAEKLAGDGSENLLERILGILGMRDTKKLSPNSTLSELGMDSMTGVEVKQTLERDFEVFLTPLEIRDLTVLRLQELSQVQSGSKNEEQEYNEGSDDVVRMFGLDAYSKEVLSSSHTFYPPLSEIPSLGNDYNPVFMIPGLEGLASSLRPLAGKLNNQCFALQLYNRTSEPLVNDMAHFLLPFVRGRLETKSPVQLVGFSFGGLVALEMLAILEEEGYRGKLVLIDSSPDVLKAGVQRLFQDGEDAYQVLFIMYFLTNWKIISPSEANNMITECEALSSWDRRLDWFLKKVSPHFDVAPDHFKGITSGIMNRTSSIFQYNWQHEQLSSRVMLLRPTVKILKMEEDYGLPKYCKNFEAMHFIEGDHLTILDHPDTAKYINEFLRPTESVLRQ